MSAAQPAEDPADVVVCGIHGEVAREQFWLYGRWWFRCPVCIQTGLDALNPRRYGYVKRPDGSE